MIGHRLVGCTLLSRGDIAASRAEFDQAIALYDPVEHPRAAARFAPDLRMIERYAGERSLPGCSAIRTPRSPTSTARLRSRASRPRDRPDGGPLRHAADPAVLSGRSATRGPLDEGLRLANEIGRLVLEGDGSDVRGLRLRHDRRARESRVSIVPAIEPYRSTGATLFMPFYQSYLARAPGRARTIRRERGARSAKLSQPCERPGPSGSRPTSIASAAKSRSSRRSATKAKRRPCSNVRLASPARRGPLLGAPRGDEPCAALARSGQARGSPRPPRAPSTAGSAKGSARRT